MTHFYGSSFLVLLAVSAGIRAEASESKWKLRAEVSTAFPLKLGGGVQIEGPGRIRLHSNLGILPDSYLDSVHLIAESADWYGPTTSQLISAALEDSVV